MVNSATGHVCINHHHRRANYWALKEGKNLCRECHEKESD